MPLYFFCSMVQKVKNDQKLKSRGPALTLSAPMGRVALSKRQVFNFHSNFFSASKSTRKEMLSLGSLVVQVQSDQEKQLFAFENWTGSRF